MQTFLPLPDFAASARCLDRRRLGKQRVEVRQLIRALTVPGAGWSRHPAALMWCGHVPALAQYGIAVCDEWIARGYNDTCRDYIAAHLARDAVMPSWFGDDAFHAAHRSNLLRKDPTHYGQFGWAEPPTLDYVWPLP